METQIDGVFQAISNDTILEETYSNKKIKNIAWTLQQYKEQIKELEECVIPMNPQKLECKERKMRQTLQKKSHKIGWNNY
jgi:hypothetical protein